jgi:hypothetical protein
LPRPKTISRAKSNSELQADLSTLFWTLTPSRNSFF